MSASSLAAPGEAARPDAPWLHGEAKREAPNGVQDGAIRSARFRKGREESWRRLETLLAKLDKKGLKALSAPETIELPRLYQIAVSSLSLARAIILDRRLLAYLENLCFRGYLAVYGPRETLAEVSVAFATRGFPAAVRSLKIYILAAFLVYAAGILAGWLQVGRDINHFHRVLPPSQSQIQVSDSPQELLANEIFPPFPGFERTFVVFANFLFRHNAQVAFLSFALSLALGVPTVLIAFYNGEVLGALLSLHAQKGLLLPYAAWLSIHSVTEILAFVLADAAGLSIAHKILFPGRESRLKALSRQGREAGVVMLGVVLMLFIAAFLEGGARQLFNHTGARIAVALLTGSLWLAYFRYAGKERP
ncbi:MAG: stage II sporulation protein M [Deltaproteobacteria bacterium]|jgi:uncharacterized membrane protein SpoIIM required for sporulation|nr:stage II sporulation protein M [Deltaproteobacteria bacterium]